MNQRALVAGLAKVCSYAYRKGVIDSSSSGDVELAQQVANRPDRNTTFRFMVDNNGTEMKLVFYTDYVISFCNKVGDKELRAFMVYNIGNPGIKKAVCTLVDAVYRTGLLDGLTISRTAGAAYAERTEKTRNQIYANGRRVDSVFWIEEIKHMAGKIHNEQIFYGIKSELDRLGAIIAASMLECTLAKNYEIKKSRATKD